MNLKELHLHYGESHYKGRKYRSYSLALPYRQNGKNRKKSVVKLGKLSDDEAKEWQTLLKAAKNPKAFLTTMDDISVSKHHKFLDVALSNAIWDEWGLDTVFPPKGKRDISIATVARILTINRCIAPKAKFNVAEWFRATALPWLLHVEANQINSSRIFRELVAIEHQKQNICDYLFKRMKKDNPDSMKSVFYDLSSSCFSGSRCLLMKFGHCKDGFKNHVVLALVVNGDGFPFYWEVLPGNTADVNTIEWLLECIKDHFKIEGITLTFDRGMVSDDNFAALEAEGIKYISAMDKNQIEGITGTELDVTQFSFLEPELVDKQFQRFSQFNKINNSTYYREIKVEGKRRYILCFNPQLFKDQRKARTQAVEDFRMIVNNLNEQLGNAKKSRNRKPTYAKFEGQLSKLKLKGFVDVTLQLKHLKVKLSDGTKRKIRTYKASVVLDDQKMLHAGRLDGFWLLVTNHIEIERTKEKEAFKLSAPEAIKPYRDKVIIESAFRDIKSFVEIEPIYVWTPLHVKAHYTICVLAYLINRTLTLRLHKHKGDKTSNIVAHQKLYRALSDCLIDHIEVENVGKSARKITRPGAQQEELLTRVGQKKLIKDYV